MDSLYDTLSSGLSYLGDAVEKPGRAVRGVLAGKPREALAAVPFSDSMGLTDPQQRTTGRDLLDHYNLTTKGSDSFGSHAAGFAADLATDPLNAVAGVGAFRAAPTIAKGLKAGAKAFTGLDLADHIASGGRALAQGGRDLLRGEAGSISTSPASWFGGRKAAVPAEVRPSALWMPGADPAASPHVWPSGMPVEHAAQATADASVPMRGVFPTEWDIAGHDPSTMAHYRPGQGQIELNLGYEKGGSPIWRDPASMRGMMDHNLETGWMAANHPTALIDHEIGHALHHRSMGDSYHQLGDQGRMTVPDARVAGHVSQYARTDPWESVAETYAGLRGGRDFRHVPDVGRMFREFAGTSMLDRMQRSGLLRGLGLGGLGAAGLGAAYAASPTRSPATAY